MLIAGVALFAAVAFSVSVESQGRMVARRPSRARLQANAEVANNSSRSQRAENTSRSRTASPTFVAPFAPTMTATKTDVLQVDNDLDLKADPGDTLRYTVVIGATGEDATGVTFTDTVDTDTAFVPGSLTTTPLARNDSFSASGNIRITVAAPGVLGNDVDPTMLDRR